MLLELTDVKRRKTPGVMLTRHARPGVLRQALSLGAKGFLAKTAPAALLADVIRRVHAGLRYVDPEFAAERRWRTRDAR